MESAEEVSWVRGPGPTSQELRRDSDRMHRAAWLEETFSQHPYEQLGWGGLQSQSRAALRAVHVVPVFSLLAEREKNSTGIGESNREGEKVSNATLTGQRKIQGAFRKHHRAASQNSSVAARDCSPQPRFIFWLLPKGKRSD